MATASAPTQEGEEEHNFLCALFLLLWQMLWVLETGVMLWILEAGGENQWKLAANVGNRGDDDVHIAFDKHMSTDLIQCQFFADLVVLTELTDLANLETQRYEI